VARQVFPESTVVRLPAGTLALIRLAAVEGGTSPAEIMRQAIIRAATPPAGRKAGRR
jgi:hypothetical protein